MQATTIPIAEIPPNTLPVAAVLASKGLPQSAPAFASVIHEILQSSVAADDEAPPQALAKNGKSTKSAATPAASTAVAGTSPLRLLRGSPMLAPAFLKQAVAPLPPATPVRASANGPVL